MEEARPLFSIITVVYNGAKHLEQSLCSILDQQYPNIEYIVIDGGSTDGTVDIIKQYEDRLSYWVSEPDQGIYNAMNKGLAKATGAYVAILNADDYSMPNTLQTVAHQFETTGADIIYGKLQKCRVFEDREYFRIEEPDLSRMKETMSIFHPSTFVKLEVYEKVGNFNEAYRLSADYDFLLRAFLAEHSFAYCPEPLTTFRVGGATTTDCRSYEEGYQILCDHNTGHQEAMKAMIGACRKKNRQRELIYSFAKAVGMRKFLDQRVEQKWRS